MIKKTSPYKSFSCFDQTVSKAEDDEEIIKISDDDEKSDFSKQSEFSRIMIEGTGGQGKSTFLYRLQQKMISTGKYEYVIIIELTELLSLKDDELSHDRLSEDSLFRHFIAYINKTEQNADKIIRSMLSDDTTGKSKPVLLLLDGLNELFASPDMKNVTAVVKELGYITDKWNHVSIIATTRPSEDRFSYKDCEFTKKYTLCKLSGVPEKQYKSFIDKHPELSDEIKELAKTPLYFNTLVGLEDTSEVKAKYDLLSKIYFKRYEQSFEDSDSFYAFYVLAPFVARKISKMPGNGITEGEIKRITDELRHLDLYALTQSCQRECGVGATINEPNYDNVRAILLDNGPLISQRNGQYKFFHDEIRDFLLAFSAFSSITALKSCAESNDFASACDIYADCNLRDEPANLLKSKLGISRDKDLYDTLHDYYDFSSEVCITPANMLYAHTAFLIFDYLNVGRNSVETYHKLTWNFVKGVIDCVEAETLERKLDSIQDENQKKRCLTALTDILSKNCEYYRINREYEKGFKLVEAAEKIYSDSDALRNQKAKLYILLHQEHIKHPEECMFNPETIGFSNYTEIYNEGIELLQKSAKRDFNLSANLLSMIYSVPAPYLFEDKTINTDFHFVDAFHLNYNVIFTNNQTDYTVREIDYTVRQAVGMLLKGYVKVNRLYGNEIGKDSIVEGEKNTLKLNDATISLAKDLLLLAEGTYRASMNYYRGIVKYYENEFDEAERLFDSETDQLLKSIFLHYRFKREISLDSLYDNIKVQLYNDKRNVADGCHPIYWYCDAKNLELAFSEERKPFFDDFEESLPDNLKSIVNELTM
ncbi:MAG: NACHT domain-containing protein [Acutalibacteraceae bacterium]